MARLGICTQYQQHESTYAALYLAEHAREDGIQASILARGPCHSGVSTHWDSHVVRERCDARQYEDFMEWANDITHLIWTHVPSYPEVDWVNHYGIESWICLVWEELAPCHGDVLKMANKLICPYRCVTQAVYRKYLADVHPVYVPWDVPAPVSTKADVVESPWLKLLLPLHDSQSRRVDQAVFKLVDAVLQKDQFVRFTITQGSGWSPGARKEVRRLIKCHPGRITVVKKPKLFQQIITYAGHDLTVWPAKFESLALVGLLSLSCGTPVIAWDIDPQSEYLVNGQNSILVPCELAENWLGVPEVIPNYEAFQAQLLQSVSDDDLLSKLRSNTRSGLADRKKEFRGGWKKLWD
jgi:hypothetical protein